MGDYGIYRGTDYGFDPVYSPNEPLIPAKYRIQPGQFGLTTNPQTANQLREVSDKLNTGAKTIELSGISTEVLESVPDQHLREIARLKKLAGADITFHGPLVEPTGINQQGWDEAQRAQAERQIWDAIKRGQQMMLKDVGKAERGEKPEYEDGNLVVTLHTSNGLMSPTTRMKDEQTGEVKITNVAVIDEFSGKSGLIPSNMLEPNAFEEGDKGKVPKPTDILNNLNKRFWQRDLNNISTQVMKGKDVIEKSLQAPTKDKDGEIEELHIKELGKMKEVFNLYHKDPQQYEEALKSISDPWTRKIIDNRVTNLAHGEGYIRDSYDAMKEAYSKAKEALEIEKRRGNEESKRKAQEALEELENFRKTASVKLKEYQQDPLKIKEFGEEVEKGVRLLQTLENTPKQYRLLEEFAVDKASDTFAGVAAKAYAAFGEKAPILSLENPPVGMGLTRADEIKKLVEATRTKLADELQNKQGLTHTEAQAAAQKLIGVTWDVGHINMMKKYGFDDKDLQEQTKIIKPFLKHVHLSDNFGLEHTELPMGMGNVPMKEHLAEIGDKMKNMKAIIETGGHWYNDFKVSPLQESFAAFGSPIYPMQMQPYWDKAQGRNGAYFAGYGMNPDIHHSIYGAGFSGLPTELGGSMQGGRNRLSGAPME